MKKIFRLLISIVINFSLLFTFACSNNNTITEGNVDSYIKTYKIGLCNYVDDASLNQIVENIISTLKNYEENYNVKFDIMSDNANADTNVIIQIVNKYISNNVDLMIGVATPVVMTMQSLTEDNNIPVIFAAVSDPVGSLIVDSVENPEKNITGTSDYLDTDSILNLMLTQNPNIKSVGFLYDVGQDSSTTPIRNAKKFLDSKNIKYIEKTGTNVQEVMLAADALIKSGVEAIFTPTDNTIMQAELSIYEKFADNKIPHYTGADSFALNGAFLGYGVDYANLGKVTAEMAIDKLINNKAIKDMPVKTFDNGIATINSEVCEKLSIDAKKIEELFSPLCTKVNFINTAESF